MRPLEHREVKRIIDDNITITVYDTDQILIESSKTMTDKHGKDIAVPLKAKYNMRNGNGDYMLVLDNFESNKCIMSGSGFDLDMIDCEAIEYQLFYHHTPEDETQILARAKQLLLNEGIDPHKWLKRTKDGRGPKNYPELEEIVGFFRDNYMKKGWKRHRRPILDVPKILKGHGNIHPKHLLHPVVIAQIIGGTVFPYERITYFDMEKGKNKLGSYGSLADHAGDVLLIKPWWHDQDSDASPVINAYIFNPVRYGSMRGDRIDRRPHEMTTANSLLEVTYGVESGEEWLHFNAWPYAGHSENVLRESDSNTWVIPDKSLVDKVQSIAPLFL